MVGRPAKSKNAVLTQRLEQYRLDNDLSYSRLAGKLGVHCTTLTRSISTDLYSREMEVRAERILGIEVSEALQLLRKFAVMLPQVSDALRSILDNDEVGY